MFVHHVFFWLKTDLSDDEVKQFENGVMSLLPIEYIKLGDIGKPAPTNRPVIERSYAYSLLLVFDNKEAHDAYQTHPVHEQFVATCSSLWEKVLIYDSETIG